MYTIIILSAGRICIIGNMSRTTAGGDVLAAVMLIPGQTFATASRYLPQSEEENLLCTATKTPGMPS